jgi:hypothetical protein
MSAAACPLLRLDTADLDQDHQQRDVENPTCAPCSATELPQAGIIGRERNPSRRRAHAGEGSGTPATRVYPNGEWSPCAFSMQPNAEAQERGADRKLKNGNNLNSTPEPENIDGPAAPAAHR